MTEIILDSRPKATLIEVMASDDSVVQAAQVSVHGVKEPDMSEKRKKGLIGYLVRSQHGSTQEHNYFKFHIEAPIFVAREFMRHRIGWGYNEISGRYAELPPKFYIPSKDRPLVNEGSGAHPKLTPGSINQHALVEEQFRAIYTRAMTAYHDLLNKGIATEVARDVLPVGLFTEFVATCNARSLMAFLSLRTSEEGATIQGHPLYEIEMVARDMEKALEEHMPYTYEHFVANGRVAP